jgi:hypothetical protein
MTHRRLRRRTKEREDIKASTRVSEGRARKEKNSPISERSTNVGSDQKRRFALGADRLFSQSKEAFMRQCRILTRSQHSWLVACLVMTACTGMPSLLAAALVTPEEVNSVRVYKQMAKSTVLVTSAYVSSHHITQASGKGLGSGILIDEEGAIVTNAHVVEEILELRTSYGYTMSVPPRVRWTVDRRDETCSPGYQGYSGRYWGDFEQGHR